MVWRSRIGSDIDLAKRVTSQYSLYGHRAVAVRLSIYGAKSFSVSMAVV